MKDGRELFSFMIYVTLGLFALHFILQSLNNLLSILSNLDLDKFFKKTN